MWMMDAIQQSETGLKIQPLAASSTRAYRRSTLSVAEGRVLLRKGLARCEMFLSTDTRDIEQTWDTHNELNASVSTMVQ